MLHHSAYELFLYILKKRLIFVIIIQLLLAFFWYIEWIRNFVIKYFYGLRLELELELYAIFCYFKINNWITYVYEYFFEFSPGSLE